LLCCCCVCSTKLVTVNRKVERREKVREAKAEKAARLSNAISAELIARLQAGTYEGSGMYVPNHVFQKALDKVGQQDDEGVMLGDEEQEDEGERSTEAEGEEQEGGHDSMRDEEADGEEEEEEEDGQYEDEVEYVEDFDEDEDDDLEDMEDRLIETEAARETETDSGHQRQAGVMDGENESKDEAGPSTALRAALSRSSSSSSGKPSATRANAGSRAGRKRGGIEIEYEEERVTARTRH
jgi:protein MAK16